MNRSSSCHGHCLRNGEKWTPAGEMSKALNMKAMATLPPKPCSSQYCHWILWLRAATAAGLWTSQLGL